MFLCVLHRHLCILSKDLVKLKNLDKKTESEFFRNEMTEKVTQALLEHIKTTLSGSSSDHVIRNTSGAKDIQ